MKNYIENEISQLIYPYEKDEEPNMEVFFQDINKAVIAMKQRLDKFGIKLNTTISLKINGEEVVIYSPSVSNQNLLCQLDNRLLKRIVNRKAFWNNAESGGHIDFIRTPNFYEFDAHTALQFFHM